MFLPIDLKWIKHNDVDEVINNEENNLKNVRLSFM